MSNAQPPVLVVGGRTTGLTMACELARHGVPVRIIDKSPGIDPHCRATVLHSRTLEILQDLGIVDPVLQESGTAARRPPVCPRAAVHARPLCSLHRRYGAEAGALYLVRPDGYIGYRDREADLDATRRYLRRVFSSPSQ